MNRTLCFLAFFLLATLCSAKGSELPILELDEGQNLVFFSITNESELTLQQLTIEVLQQDLPVQLTIAETAQRIDIAEKTRSTRKLILPIHVGPGMQGKSFELRTVLRDANDHKWDANLLATVSQRLPETFALMQNIPNPFNSTTLIAYTLPDEQSAQTRLQIYNSLGQNVRTLVSEHQRPGSYTHAWDGLDDQGQGVSSGTYFYRLEWGAFVQSRKMTLTE